jgi:hypothetical protein
MGHPEVSQTPKVELMSSLYEARGLFHQRLCGCPPIHPKRQCGYIFTSHKPQYAAIVILVTLLQVDHRTSSCFAPTREELWFNKQNASPLAFFSKNFFL